MLTRLLMTLALIGSLTATGSSFAADEEHPLSKTERTKLADKFQQQITDCTERLAKDPKDVDQYSKRADAYFFLADFPKAVADYEKMVELNPKIDAEHWRRGIARFYAGQYPEAAKQFESYHSFDDVDRENGIWRFFSQFKAHGAEKARAGLLLYKKDDREPFPSVYKLFSKDMTAEQVLGRIKDADLSATEREKQVFYASLYVGLNEALEGRPESARPHLRVSTANKWGPTAGYGPNYMWHVGRLHFDLLSKQPPK